MLDLFVGLLVGFLVLSQVMKIREFGELRDRGMFETLK